MKFHPVPLVLFGFVPTFVFLSGASYLVKADVVRRGKPCSRMLMGGALLVFLGGFTKALWKFIVAVEFADISWLSRLQFIHSGIGFLGMCMAVIYMVRGQRKFSLVPAMVSLTSAKQTIAMQWIEENVNTAGQSGFMPGCIWLYRDYTRHGCGF